MVSKINPCRDGVTECFHHCIEDVSGLKTTVESLENREELKGSMVVAEGKLNQLVMNTAVGVGNIQPAHSQSLVLALQMCCTILLHL